MVVHQEEHAACKKIDWCGAGLVICLEWSADDLHMVQMIPLPARHLLLHPNPEWFNLSGAGLRRLSWKRGRYRCLSCDHLVVLSHS